MTVPLLINNYPKKENLLKIVIPTLLDKFLESAFGGSSTELVMQLLGNKKASAQELKEIRKIID